MGELTDLIFTLIGKLGRWYNVKGQRISFIIWALVMIYWMARNLELGLMVQSGGCVVSFGLHVYGWWNWKNKNIGTK